MSVTTVLKLSKSWDHFKQLFQELYGQTTLDFEKPRMELNMDKKETPSLSSFNKKLKRGLNWNPNKN